MDKVSFEDSGTEVRLGWLGLKLDIGNWQPWAIISLSIYKGSPMSRFRSQGIQRWGIEPNTRELPVERFMIVSFGTDGFQKGDPKYRNLTSKERGQLSRQIRKIMKAQVPGRNSAFKNFQEAQRDYFAKTALFLLSGKGASS